MQHLLICQVLSLWALTLFCQYKLQNFCHISLNKCSSKWDAPFRIDRIFRGETDDKLLARKFKFEVS